MHAPEWQIDASSNGLFYVNYGKHRVVPSDILGSEYVVDTIPYGQEYFWGYQEWPDNHGVMHRSSGTLIWDTLVAEILEPIEAVRPTCNCGKDKAGRQDIGDHSYWCNVAQGYTRR